MAIPFLENVDLNRNQLLNAAIQQIAGDHGSPVQGVLWFDTVSDRVKYYDGASVRTIATLSDLTGGSGGDASTLGGQAGAYYLSRDNHTGTQLAATISDFDQAVNALLATYATQAYVDDAVAAGLDEIRGIAPEALDTLAELAAALQNNPDVIADILTGLGERTRQFSATVGNGTDTALVVTHNLNTTDVSVSIYRTAAPGQQVFAAVERTSANTITVRTASPQPLDSLRVVVTGR